MNFFKTLRTYSAVFALMLFGFVSQASAEPASTLADALTVDLTANMSYVYAAMAGVMAVAVAVFAYRKVKGAVKFG